MPGPGGWHFVPLPQELTPPVTHGWGRTPVRATVGDYTWETSVWKDTRRGETLLAIPKAARAGLGDGDQVEVTIVFRAL